MRDLGGEFLEELEKTVGNREIPRPGEIYRHFKGNLYQIVTIATHTEDRETLVIYQALYGDYKCFARPLTMFMSKVDTIKYPHVKAIYRFEKYEPDISSHNAAIQGDDFTIASLEGKEANKEFINPIDRDSMAHNMTIDNTTAIKVDNVAKSTNIENVDEVMQVNPILMSFLDATTFREKLEIIQSNRKELNDKLINDMAMAIDCTVAEGDIDERISSLIFCLQTRIRFEARVY